MNAITQPINPARLVAPQQQALQDAEWVRWSLIAIAVSFKHCYDECSSCPLFNTA